MTAEARKVAPALHRAFTAYTLQGDDGLSCTVDVFNGAAAVAELADSLAMRLPERYTWDELMSLPK